MRNWKSVCRAALLGAGACGMLACSDRVSTASGLAGRTRLASRELPREAEPNGNAAQATNLADDAVVRANLHPDGDADFYRFTAQAGNRVYAATQTASSSATDGSPADSVLDVIDANGMLLESDNDNGFIGALSSSIAGTSIPTPGTYYLRVSKNGGGELRPYDLHFRRRAGAPGTETEPNDDPSQAGMLPQSGWVSGSIRTSDDVDVYPLGIGSGSTVFASLDLDPDRDGIEWDGVIELGPFDGSFLRVNDQTGAAGTPSSEALLATVWNTGDYYLRVSSAGSGESGSYVLSVSVRPGGFATESCQQMLSGDVPKAIPEGPGRVTSTIDLDVTDWLIADLDVVVEIAHSHPEDLDVHLRSPAGNDNVLFTDVGSDAFPHLHFDIDDEAAFPITPASDPHFAFTGQTALSNMVVQPEVSDGNYFRSGNRLHWFDGEDPGGTWTLVVDDDSPGNSGTLLGWGLRICLPSVATCPNDAPAMFALDATFESDAHGFTHSGTSDQWAFGTPTWQSGFDGCYRNSGQCWKTNLDGYYVGNSTQDLASPEIDLTNAVAPVQLSFALKYQLESATYDHAWVEVREVGGANTLRVWEFLDATMWEEVGDESAPEYLQETAGWGVKTIDVSAYAGRRIELVFHLDSDQYVEFAGLAVDDVRITHCGCGDSIVGPGEQCDDGAQNGKSGSCCTQSCQVVTNGNGCSDGSACTDGEICTNGICGNGKPVHCDDGNLCTNDSCDVGTGCVHAFNTAPCSVGACRLGICVAGGTGGSAGTEEGGSGGAEDNGGEGGSPEGGSGNGARGGTAPGGGEGGASSGGTRSRGGSDTGGTGLAGETSGGEGGESDGGAGTTRPVGGTDDGSSCGCRIPGERGPGKLPAWLALSFAAALLVRRRHLRTPRSSPRVTS